MPKKEDVLAPIPQVTYTPIVRPVETNKSPTLKTLLSTPGPRVKVTIPKRTLAFGATYQPICLGNSKFEPGETYALHPTIAAEIRNRIEEFEKYTVSTVSGINMAGVKALELTPEGYYPETHVIGTVGS